MIEIQKQINKPDEHQWKKERQRKLNNMKMRKNNMRLAIISIIGEYHTENIYESSIRKNN